MSRVSAPKNVVVTSTMSLESILFIFIKWANLYSGRQVVRVSKIKEKSNTKIENIIKG